MSVPHAAAGGGAVLIAWTDIAADEEEDFNDWYNREHMRDRVIGVPGFLRGRRYVAVRGEPRYLALYDATGPEILNSEAYIGLISAPDPRSQHFILRFRNAIRTLGRLTVSAGEAEGAMLAVVPLSPPTDRRDALRATVADELIPALLKQRGVVAAHLIERDEATRAASTRRHVRQGDRSLDWALLIEAADLADLSRAADEALGDRPGLAVDPAFEVSLFQLAYRVEPRSPASGR